MVANVLKPARIADLGFRFPEQYGAVGDGTTDDTAALNTFHQDCCAKGYIAVVPAKTYKVSGEIVASGGPVQIAAQQGAKYVSTSATANILRVGVISPPDLVNGFIEGLTLIGPTSAPAQNGQVALMLDNILQLRITSVTVKNTDIGFDAINNCYGAVFTNCRAGFFGSCNVGLNFRIGPQSGNQWTTYGCWFNGKIAGVSLSPGSDGLVMHGGQLSAAGGQSGSQDAYGAVTWGKDYLTGSTGGLGSIKVDSVDFEGCAAWFFRGYGPATLSVNDCPLLSNGTVPTIGVMKNTDGGDASYLFKNNRVAGTFSGPAFSLPSFGASAYLEESGWVVPAGTTFGGVDYGLQRSLLANSGISTGISMWRDATGIARLSLDGLQIRRSALTNTADTTPVDPASLSGRVLDLDASRITGIADGGVVASWTDDSGAGNTAVQATSTNQPLYRSTWASNLLPNNGRPIVYFDGSNDFMTSAASSSTAETVFVVAQAVAFGTLAGLIGSQGGSGGFAMRIANGNTIALEADGAAAINSTSQSIPTSTGVMHLYAASYANTGAFVTSYDGISATGTSSAALTASRTTKIGAIASGSSWNGAIARVIKFSRVLTTAERTGVEAYLMKRYAIG